VVIATLDRFLELRAGAEVGRGFARGNLTAKLAGVSHSHDTPVGLTGPRRLT
jgi:hypothetical protein